MNNQPRDLVLKALQHQETDFCPYVIWVKDANLKAKLAEHYKVQDIFESIICNHIEFCGHLKAAVTPLADGSYRDEFGTILDIGSIPHVIQPALSKPSLEGYTFPNLATDSHFTRVPTYIQQFPDRIPHCAVIGIVF